MNQPPLQNKYQRKTCNKTSVEQNSDFLDEHETIQHHELLERFQQPGQEPAASRDCYVTEV